MSPDQKKRLEERLRAAGLTGYIPLRDEDIDMAICTLEFDASPEGKMLAARAAPVDALDALMAEWSATEGGAGPPALTEIADDVPKAPHPTESATVSPSEGSPQVTEVLSTGKTVAALASTEGVEPTAISVRPEKKPAASYQFIDERDSGFADELRRCQESSTDHLLGMLADIRQDMSPYSGAPPVSYAQVRARLCAANLVLNERHEIAPGFRRWPALNASKSRAVKAEDATADHELVLLMRDRQLIDLDWIGRHEASHPTDEARTLWAAGHLDRERASRFAASTLTAEKKVGLLGIAAELEPALAHFRSEEVRKRWDQVNRQRDSVRAKIRAALSAERSRRAESAEELQVIHIVLSLAEGHLSRAAFLLPRAGLTCAPKKLQRLRRWFDDHDIPLCRSTV